MVKRLLYAIAYSCRGRYFSNTPSLVLKEKKKEKLEVYLFPFSFYLTLFEVLNDGIRKLGTLQGWIDRRRHHPG